MGEQGPGDEDDQGNDADLQGNLNAGWRALRERRQRRRLMAEEEDIQLPMDMEDEDLQGLPQGEEEGEEDA